ncbi:hypothetical protein SAMN04488029_0977 [Reichenbachiella faecimaris]|uniref:DUF1579 domain-containing protein n=1 Tax=Reichenbachiella faecimaris TaxID=692418 RepID=A0A1W2G7I3_REIFA|nr:hypothetical protein [Reichenbachiella faecimaris]SMD32627.1 hypothetical protein SAMN04488029_0977 [Reichenbachiella faecimaris]
MKIKTLVLALSLLPLGLVAQPDFSELAKQKIAALDMMIGTWEGTGYMNTPAGKESSKVKENLQYQLDGTVIMAEGRGTKIMGDGSEKVVHNALGIISFNPFTQQYQMNSFIAKGMSTQAKLEIKDANSVVWWIEAGPATMRYSLTIKDDEWIEIGERSMDKGENWQQFFEMKLKKVS